MATPFRNGSWFLNHKLKHLFGPSRRGHGLVSRPWAPWPAGKHELAIVDTGLGILSHLVFLEELKIGAYEGNILIVKCWESVQTF